jgi:hypothetical protein
VDLHVRSAYSRHATAALLGSTQTRPTTRRKQLTRTFSKQRSCSYSLGKRRSSIRLWIRASKLLRSAKPAEPQSGTQAKKAAIPSLMLTAAVIEGIARTKLTTRLSRKLRIRKLKHKSNS